MDGRGRLAGFEQGRRGAAEYLVTVVPVLRRHGLPRHPGARRLGGVRFASDFVAGRGPGPDPGRRSRL